MAKTSQSIPKFIRSGAASVFVIKDVNQTGRVLLQNERPTCLRAPQPYLTFRGLGQEQEKDEEDATGDENEFHASHLLHSARTSPTRLPRWRRYRPGSR